MPSFFIEQLRLSETGAVFLHVGSEGGGEAGEGGEVSLSRRCADEGEVRLTGMPFVAPLKILLAPRDSAAVMIGMAGGGGKGGAGGEGGDGQQSA